MRVMVRVRVRVRVRVGGVPDALVRVRVRARVRVRVRVSSPYARVRPLREVRDRLVELRVQRVRGLAWLG